MMGDELIQNATTYLFELSEITKSLPNDARIRYLDKLSCINSDCPYNIDDRIWAKNSHVFSLIPPITDLDIINYLVFRKSA
jgi:hypothetical protein